MRLLILVGLCACTPAPTAAPLPVPASASAGRTPDAPRLSDQEEACLMLQRAYQARLDVATGACATDLDCGCYAGVAPGLGCGDVTDFKSATALASLATQFTGAGCSMPQQCADRPCVADCVDGKCVRRVQPY